MSVLLIVSDVDADALTASPLARSLAAQSDPGWTFDRAQGEPLATVAVAADTLLRPDAIASIRTAFGQHPGIDGLIGDALIGGERRLRPAWSPTASAACPEELDLVAVRGAATMNGTLAARVDALAAHAPTAIGHLPEVLVERDEPEPVDDRAIDAVERLIAARRSGPRPGAITFVIPTAGTRAPDGSRLVEQAIVAARRSGVEIVEILLIAGAEFGGDPTELEAPDVRVVERPGPWNFSAAINTGLLASTHATVALLNDDIEMIEPDWARPLTEHLRDPEVALVGPALLYPDHTIQHVGMVIDDAFPLHSHVGARLADLPSRHRSPREVAALTAACLLGRRADLLAVGGLTEALPVNFNDADLCFKLQRTVGRIIVDPTTPLLHHESASRQPVIEDWEWETFVGRWGEIVDPWYHPGHHRPDEPTARRRNADHLPPRSLDGRWPLRTPTVRPSVHRARMTAPSELADPE
ncbi:MAG: glycosyltransferase [Actinomycetota bacterium]